MPMPRSCLRLGPFKPSGAYPTVTESVAQLLLTGQHDRNPVTTKHEKRSISTTLFSACYISFLGRRFRSLTCVGIGAADFQNKQHRDSQPDCCPNGICWVLPAVFKDTRYSCNESSNENDHQNLRSFVYSPHR